MKITPFHFLFPVNSFSSLNAVAFNITSVLSFFLLFIPLNLLAWMMSVTTNAMIMMMMNDGEFDDRCDDEC